MQRQIAETILSYLSNYRHWYIKPSFIWLKRACICWVSKLLSQTYLFFFWYISPNCNNKKAIISIVCHPLFTFSHFLLDFFGLWIFFQCVKTRRGYMETAALCKYLWCNISMWIDFPSSPSIKSATSSNRPLDPPNTRPPLRPQEAKTGASRSPRAQSNCFSFEPGPPGHHIFWECGLLPFISLESSKPIGLFVSVVRPLAPKMVRQGNVM